MQAQVSVEEAVYQAYEDYRRAMRAVVMQLSDDDLNAELAKERPYDPALGPDANRGRVMFRAMVKVELRRRERGE